MRPPRGGRIFHAHAHGAVGGEVEEGLEAGHDQRELVAGVGGLALNAEVAGAFFVVDDVVDNGESVQKTGVVFQDVAKVAADGRVNTAGSRVA